jgi:hypothetical protein
MTKSQDAGGVIQKNNSDLRPFILLFYAYGQGVKSLNHREHRGHKEIFKVLDLKLHSSVFSVSSVVKHSFPKALQQYSSFV